MYRKLLTHAHALLFCAILATPLTTEGRDWESKPLKKEGNSFSSDHIAFEPQRGTPFIQGNLSGDYYLSSGDFGWTEDFLFLIEAVDFLNIASILEWDDLDADMPVVSGHLTFWEWLTVYAAWGEGDIKSGNSNDTDTFASIITGSRGNISRSETGRVTGDTEFIDLRFQFNFFALFDENLIPPNIQVGFFAGYKEVDQSVTTKGGRQTIISDISTNLGFPDIPTTRFESSWEGFNFGISGAGVFDTPFPFQLFFQGSLAYLFEMDYEGRGFWFLRPEFRQGEEPSFIQDAKEGTGLEFDLRSGVRIAEHIELFVGFRYLELEIDEGISTTFFSNGTTDESNLVKATQDRTGIYVGGGITF